MPLVNSCIYTYFYYWSVRQNAKEIVLRLTAQRIERHTGSDERQRHSWGSRYVSFWRTWHNFHCDDDDFSFTGDASGHTSKDFFLFHATF